MLRILEADPWVGFFIMWQYFDYICLFIEIRI